MGWKPGEHEPEGEQKDFDNRPLPSGLYLVGSTWYARKGADGRVFRLRGENIAEIGDDGGLRFEMVGRSFFHMMSARVEKQFNADRWYWFMKAIGKLGEELDFSDGCIERVVMGSACIMRVTRKKRTIKRDGKTVELWDHDVINFRPPTTDAQIKAVETWKDKWAEIQAEKAAKAAELAAKADELGGGGAYSDDPYGFGDDPGPEGDGIPF